MIKRTLTDRSGVQVNPINGNLLYTQALLSLPGIGQSASVGLRYNVLNDARPTLNVGLFEAQLYRDPAGNITYTAPDGAAYVFAPGGASYSGYDHTGMGAMKTLYRYTQPSGVSADLVRVGLATGPGTEYDLTMHPSQMMNVYVDNGSNITLNSSQDVTAANHVSYTYASGALSTITDTQNRTISFAYTDPNNTTQPSTVTDNSLSRTISLTYGTSGALSKIVDATGAQTLFTYNPTSGKLATVTDGRGDGTAFTYDSSNRLSTLVAASSSTPPVPATTSGTWTMAYPLSTSTTWTDPNNNPTTYTTTFTPAPQVTKVTDGNGRPHTASYNAHNDPLTLADGLVDTTTMGYATGTNNLTSMTAPSTTVGTTTTPGRQVMFGYTASGAGPYSTADFRPNTVTDAQGQPSSLTYNNFGETITSSTDTLQGGTQHHTYQGDDQGTTGCSGHTGQVCTSTDGKGNVTSYTYDTAGNVSTITPPSPLGVQTFTYDAAGRKISELDGRSHTAYTCYDNNDRITQVSYTSSSCSTATGVTYTYDPAGNMKQRVSAAGTTTVTYDAMNRPLSKTDGSTPTTLTYDRADNITSYTDPAGTTNYTYDAANNVLTLAEPTGTCPTGATTTVPITTPNSTKCVGFTYDQAERRTHTYLPNGVLNTTTFDGSSRMTAIKATSGAATLAERDYTYNNASAADTALIQSTKDPVTGGAPGTQNNYTYDKLNRLTQTATGPIPATGSLVPTSTVNWTFDQNGNRTSQSGTSIATTNYGYNAADELCWTAPTTGTGCTTPAGGTTYSYDGNGNQTSGGNTYSNYDQLDTATTVGTQTYAGTTNNERSQAGSTNFTNSILGKISAAITSSTTQEYVRDPHGTLIAMQLTDPYSTKEYYYTADTTHSTILVSDNAGTVEATYIYDSYGNTTATTGGTFATTTNPWRYGGGYTDRNNTIKLGARYYNPTLGRFTQPDPSGQEPNNYTYAADNPITNSDMTGLDWAADLAGGIVGFVVGVAVTGLTAGCVICGGIAAGAAAGATINAASQVQSSGSVTNWGSVGIAAGVGGAGGAALGWGVGAVGAMFASTSG